MRDHDIVAGIREGRNEQALSALYRHLPAISRMIRAYGGSREEAKDIFQEALLVFCRKAREADFALSAGSYAYLHSVCRFLWQDELRKNARLPLIPREELPGESTETPSPGDAVAEEQRYRLAEKVITMLPDRCRELLARYYSASMRLRDIAQEMGYATEASAKNQKYKCLEAARKRFKEELHSTGIL